MLYGRFAANRARAAGWISAQKSVVSASPMTALKFARSAKRSSNKGSSFRSNSTATTRPARSEARL